MAEDLAEAVPKAAVAAQAAAAAEKGAKEEALWLFPGMGGGHTVRSEMTTIFSEENRL